MEFKIMLPYLVIDYLFVHVVIFGIGFSMAGIFGLAHFGSVGSLKN